MSARTLIYLTASLVLGATALAACRAVNEEKPIDWKVSWAPAQAHEDNTPLASQPTYELEMATGPAAQGPWVVVWTGSTTTANVPALPGHKCFRAVTVENGVRSEPSEVICATKLADESDVRYAEKGNKGSG